MPVNDDDDDDDDGIAHYIHNYTVNRKTHQNVFIISSTKLGRF